VITLFLIGGVAIIIGLYTRTAFILQLSWIYSFDEIPQETSYPYFGIAFFDCVSVKKKNVVIR
jgi:hypothetical protein